MKQGVNRQWIIALFTAFLLSGAFYAGTASGGDSDSATILYTGSVKGAVGPVLVGGG